MQLTVSGKQVELSDALRTRVASSLDQIAQKYFDHALEVHVTFGRARSFFTCDINVHAGRGLMLRGEGEAADANAAFDDAAEHIAKRLRRYRRRVNDHARDQVQRDRPETARGYVLRQDDLRHNGTVPGPAPDQVAELEGDQLVEHAVEPHLEGAFATIIAEHTTDILHLTLGEAVMRMDLANEGLLMFRHQPSGRLNVIYRRGDGNIGWIDPADKV